MDITDNERTFVIAEAGVNHDGDLSVAHELIDVAHEAGAGAVKFQTFDPASLVSLEATTTPYQREAGFKTSQYEMLRRLTLPQTGWAELKLHCEKLGIQFMSTPFDEASAEFLVELGVSQIKVGSGELTNLPYLKRLSQLDVPLILSTGMSNILEVEAAVNATSSAPRVSLLHCVSSYPAPPNQANLNAIPVMKGKFGVPIGWSDHTTSVTTAIVSVALGASIIEKHITTDKNRSGPDHSSSMEPFEFKEYVRLIREAEGSLGDGEKRRQPAERENAKLVRRSLHARRRLAVGETITADDVIALRPDVGLSPGTLVEGLIVREAVEAGSAIYASSVARSS